MFRRMLFFYRRNSLRIRMALISLIMALVPLFIIQAALDEFFFDYVNDTTAASYDEFFNQVNNHLSDHMNKIIQTSNMLFLNAGFQDTYIENKDLPLWRITEREEITRMLQSYNVITDIINDAAFIPVDQPDQIYYTKSYYSKLTNADLRYAIQCLDEMNLRPYQMRVLCMFDENGKIRNQILAIRRIMWLENVFTDLGWGVLQFDRKVLQDVLTSNSIAADTTCFIVNEEGLIVCCTQSAYDGLQMEDVLIQSDSDQAIFQDKPHLYRANAIESMNWKIIAVVSEESLYAPGIRLQSIMLVVMLISGVLMISMSIFFNMSLTTPLQKLSEAFRKVSSGQLNTHLTFKSHNEITAIADGFNQMVDNVRTLSARSMEMQQKLYETEIERTRYELSGLQSQINSHFLYNTLNTICSMVQLDNKPETIKCLHVLIQYLRYAANNRIYVPIREEISHLENYLVIQNLRFMNRFKLIIDAPDDLLDVPVLKLTLQPIVENAIKHGFAASSGKGLMKLSIRQEEKGLHIRLLDNGAGMDEDRLVKLRLMLAISVEENIQAAISSNSIGLINIRRRLMIYYGAESNMDVNSWQGRGTVVHIWIPCQARERGTREHV